MIEYRKGDLVQILGGIYKGLLGRIFAINTYHGDFNGDKPLTLIGVDGTWATEFPPHMRMSGCCQFEPWQIKHYEK